MVTCLFSSFHCLKKSIALLELINTDCSQKNLIDTLIQKQTNLNQSCHLIVPVELAVHHEHIFLKLLNTFVTWTEAWKLKTVCFLPKISPALMRPDGKTRAFNSSRPYGSFSPAFLLITHTPILRWEKQYRGNRVNPVAS